MEKSLMHHMGINTLMPRKIAATSETTFSNALSWMKVYELRFKFH